MSNEQRLLAFGCGLAAAVGWWAGLALLPVATWLVLETCLTAGGLLRRATPGRPLSAWSGARRSAPEAPAG